MSMLRVKVHCQSAQCQVVLGCQMIVFATFSSVLEPVMFQKQTEIPALNQIQIQGRPLLVT